MLDVRSPGEFQQGALPGAVSFPLFTNDERAEVGTIYKERGKHEAVLRGLEIIGPRMTQFIKEAEKLKSDTLAIYCWRGGMRSESMAWLLGQYGFQTLVLEGGYKAYRRHILAFFEQPLKLLVVDGNTGSGKTHLLHALARLGAQVLDLEGIANHQGSSFGKYNEGFKPNTEQFQNLLFHAAQHFDLSRPIWIEDEGIRIGQVILPDGLYRQMTESWRIVIETPRDQRLDWLVQSYRHLSKEQLTEATLAIRKKLGFDQADRAVTLIAEGRIREAADIILHYYDKRYDMQREKKMNLIAATYVLANGDIQGLAKELLRKHGKN